MLKYLLIIVVLSLNNLEASTVTASVGGTLRVYELLSAYSEVGMLFPAQFTGTLSSNLINVHNSAPATGIPNEYGDTRGRAGVVTIEGTGGTFFSITTNTATLTNTSSTINASLSAWSDTAYTIAVPTQIPGSSMGTNLDIYIKGVISSGTNIIPGTYIGTGNINIIYNN